MFKRAKLIGSRNSKDLGVGSRLIADLTAKLYQENLAKYAKGNLLDLGCGNVPLYGAYKEYVTDNICVDWENTLHQNQYLDFELDLTGTLPFCDCHFNTIILSDVLEHIPQPERLCKEMCRVLCNDGTLIMNVPFFYWIHERPHDFYRYTEFALKRFIEESGFALVKLKTIGGSPEILADMLAKHFQILPLIGVPIAIFIQYVTAALIRTTFGKKISNKTSEAFPYGYFLVAQKK